MIERWIPGAVLRVYSRRRGVWHFGIAAWENGLVYHASKDRGQFLKTTFEEFSEGQDTSYSWIPQSGEEQGLVLERAPSHVGRPFNLLKANCEDYVNAIVTGTPRSLQRETAGVFVLAALAIVGIAALSA